MSLRLAMAAVAVVAVPVALYAQQPAAPAAATSERRICRTNVDIGSRIARSRRCRSESEDEARKMESREVVDRMQALKIFNNIDPVPGSSIDVSNGRTPR